MCAWSLIQDKRIFNVINWQTWLQRLSTTNRNMIRFLAFAKISISDFTCNYIRLIKTMTVFNTACSFLLGGSSAFSGWSQCVMWCGSEEPCRVPLFDRAGELVESLVAVPTPLPKMVPPKKKVRLSLDEYKKRKTTDDALGAPEDAPAQGLTEEALLMLPPPLPSPVEPGAVEHTRTSTFVSFIPPLKDDCESSRFMLFGLVAFSVVTLTCFELTSYLSTLFTVNIAFSHLSRSRPFWKSFIDGGASTSYIRQVVEQRNAWYFCTIKPLFWVGTPCFLWHTFSKVAAISCFCVPNDLVDNCFFKNQYKHFKLDQEVSNEVISGDIRKWLSIGNLKSDRQMTKFRKLKIRIF